MSDIKNEDDVELFVRSFYGKALKDEQLAPFFKHMNFEKHIPKMIHFMSFKKGDTKYKFRSEFF